MIRTTWNVLRRPRGPWRWFLLLWFLFSGAIGLWSLATPLMAFPDEPAHSIQAAAVVRGEIGIAEGSSFGHGVHVEVPAYIAGLHALDCFKFHPDVTADCAPDVTNDTFPAIGVTTAAGYNPFYYMIVGLPTLVLSGAPAIYGMRLVSAILTAAFYAAGITSLTQMRRPFWPVAFAGVACTPMILFLSGGVSPNALEIAATLAAFAGLCAILDTADKRILPMPALVGVVAAMSALANTRQIALVWMLCTVVVALIAFRHPNLRALFTERRVWIGIGAIFVAVVAGVLWIYSMLHAPASQGTAPIGIINPAPGIAPYQAFITMLDITFDFIPQYIGVMGWLDTPLPVLGMLFWTAAFVALLISSFFIRPRRARWVVWFAFALLAIVPGFLQASLITTMGYVWQGRYNLPLVVVCFVVTGIALRNFRAPTRSVPRRFTLVVLWFGALSHVFAFAYVLRRYTVGVRNYGNWQTMVTDPSWQPPLSWPVLFGLYCMVIAAAAVLLWSGFINQSAGSRLENSAERPASNESQSLVAQE